MRKFRSFAEARRALWLPAADPAILRAMKRLAGLAVQQPQERGVSRFRTIEEAKRRKRSPGRRHADSRPA